VDDVLAQDACFSLKQLAVNGNELIALGYQGKEVGDALETLLNNVIDGKTANNKSDLLASLELQASL